MAAEAFANSPHGEATPAATGPTLEAEVKMYDELTNPAKLPQVGHGPFVTRSAVLIDDHQMILDGLSALLLQIDPMIRISTANDMEQGLKLLRTRPELVFVDLGLGDSKGLETLNCVLANAPSSRVAVVSGANEPGRMRAVYKAGAAAFIPKSMGPTELKSALTKFINEGFFFPVEAMEKQGTDLTPQALRILRLLEQGLENKEIALLAAISTETVKYHVSTLMERFGVSNRLQLINAARSSGIID